MNLRKQIFLSFLFVAVAPLLIVMGYLFHSNTQLAFDLYRQNLKNATAIQADIIEENINRTMVKAGNLAYALEKAGVLEPGAAPVLERPDAAAEILEFVEDTLDSLQVFTLFNRAGEVVYSSGSNRDTALVEAGAKALPDRETQFVSEIAMGEDPCCIAIATPVGDGRLVAVYRNAFFLKSISSHTQLEGANAFLYCRDHGGVVVAKQAIEPGAGDFGARVGDGDEGAVFFRLENEQVEASFRRVDKTPWVLVNDIPVRAVHAIVLQYLAINVLVFACCLTAVLLLSRVQSRRILQPMEWLLHAVEDFFVTGRADFVNPKIGRKTEVGYLAEKFGGLAADTAAAQGNLRESNYLYEAILHSGYEGSITIDYRADRLETTYDTLDFSPNPELTAPERMMDYYRRNCLDGVAWDRMFLADMIYGRLKAPVEGDVGMRAPDGQDRWYQILAVPILDGDGAILKTVLHLRNITGQKQEELKLLRSSQRDPLCGLLNKAALIEQAASASGTGRSAMFFVDLDHFKQANDLLGHLAGDDVLLAVAEVLRGVFRGTDLLCRYGGDEFVVLAPRISQNVAERKAAQLVERLHLRRTDGEHEVLVTASVGVWMTEAAEPVESMIRHADEAMYQAKQNGKARYYILKNKK